MHYVAKIGTRSRHIDVRDIDGVGYLELRAETQADRIVLSRLRDFIRDRPSDDSPLDEFFTDAANTAAQAKD